MTLTGMTRAVARAAMGLLMVGSSLYAQQGTANIVGRVTADGVPLEAANVLIPDLNISAGTGANGRFAIVIPRSRLTNETVVMRVRAIGYIPESRTVQLKAGEQTFDFALKKDANRLNQVVVTGVTGATEQIKVPFSVAQINASDMPVPGVNPLSQLQGKVPGANIVSYSGRPGAQPAVLLRGPTSINAAGRGQDPLYVVDGIILAGGLPDLNPLDIESVEVVKGAAASSLYGSRAGNGVIQISTKNGKFGSQNTFKFGVRAEYGTGDIERKISIAQNHGMLLNEDRTRFCQSGTVPTGMAFACYNSFDYQTTALAINQRQTDFANAPPGLPIDPGAGASGQQLRGVFAANLWPGQTFDAVDQFAQPSPFGLYNIDATGRFGSTSFYASANLTRQGGSIAYLKGLNRNGFRLNLDHRVNDMFTVTMNTAYSRSETDGLNEEDGGGGAFFRLTRTPPIVDLTRTDSLGRLFIRPNLQAGGSQNNNPLYNLQNIKRNDLNDRVISGASAKFNPASWVDFEGNISYDLTRSNGYQNTEKGYRTVTADPATNNGSVFYYGQTTQGLNASFNATARQSIGKDLRVRYNARYLYEQQNFDGFNGSGSILAVVGVPTINNTTATTRSGSSSQTQTRQIGMFGGVNLDYRDRYILDVAVRRDGSSLFGENNRWANYGRVSGAWVASQESWWKIPGVNLFKLRASQGSAGNRPNFAAQYETFSINAAGIPVPGVLGNRNLKPEVVTETEIGADIELFNKIGIKITNSNAIATNQILQPPLSAAAGFTSQWLNAGTLENKVWEAQVSLPLIQSRNMDWSVTMNFDRVRSMVTKLDVQPYNVGNGNVTNSGNIFRIEAGVPYGELRGRSFVTNCSQLPATFASNCGTSTSAFQKNSDGWIVWTGGAGIGEGVTKNLWLSNLAATRAPWGVRLAWGHPIVIRDANGAGITQNILGNVLPNYKWSTSTNFRYKRFTAYGLLDANVGRAINNQGLAWSLLDFLWGGSDQVGKSVTEAKPMSYYYRAGPPDNSAGIGGLYDVLGPNNFNTESGTFARVREVVVSYRVGRLAGVPGDWNASLVGRNLYTFTNYRGFDPEVGVAGGQAGSGVLNAFDNFTFPNTRTFTFSIGTSF